MKTAITVTQVNKGFMVEVKDTKGLLSAHVFETANSLGEFFKIHFDKPAKPKVIRRRRGLREVELPMV